jgi:hypothetical protein
MRKHTIRGYLAAAVIACCGCMALAEQVHPENADQQKSQASETQKQTAPQPPIIVNVSPPQKTKSEIEEDAKEHEEKSKLDRQLVKLTADLANYTLGLFIATIALVLATASLGYFAWRQAEDTQESLANARTSADAANKSAEIAERALIAGQRAFLSVSFVPSVQKILAEDRITHWNFMPVWKNSGETPTRNMTNHINIRLFDRPIPMDWEFPDIWVANTPVEDRSPIPLGAAPRDTVNGQTVGVTIDEMKGVVAGTKWLYFWGWATYNDVFPNTPLHVTRFAVRIIAGGDPTSTEKISISFPYIGKYNCTDDECEYQGYPANWVPSEIDS